MSLSGIPISENQCMGDSLPFINDAFVSLDTRVETLSTNFVKLSSNIMTSLSSTGYASLPGHINGLNNPLFFQWGTLSNRNLAGKQNYTVVFPMQFNNECINITATASYNESVAGKNIAAVVQRTTFNSVSAVIGTDNTNSGTITGDIYWNAIGY